MGAVDPDKACEAGLARAWYRSAVAMAVIGGAFSVVITVVMAASYASGRIGETRLEKRLEELKAQLGDRGANEEAIIAEIRRLDVEFRQMRFRRLGFCRTGRYILLASAAVFVVGVKLAGAIKARVPRRKPAGERAGEQMRQASLARWSVGGALGLACAAAVFLALIPYVEPRVSDGPVVSYPPVEQIKLNWHRFRGPEGAGVSADANMPDDWDGKSGRGIVWKARVPLAGNNSPVVWADRVFLSGGDANDLGVFCFDAKSGGLLWSGEVERTRPRPGEEPFEVMEDTGYAASSVATNGRYVFAIFVTGDVACFDFEGRNLWTKRLGIPDSIYGYASSLEVYKGLVLIQFDQGDVESGKSRLIALEALSGRVVWETKRPVANSWSSPIVVYAEGVAQLITAADPYVIAYQPETGAEIWRAKCLRGDIAPSPIYSAGLAFAVEPYSKLVAIRTDGQGDVTGTGIAWSLEEPAPDICSPVADGKFVYILNTDGLLLCCRIADGKKIWEQELRAEFLASPSIVGERLYLLSEKGVMIIAAGGERYEQLGRCELGERCLASPAFVDGHIYIRAEQNLYCIGEPFGQEP